MAKKNGTNFIDHEKTPVSGIITGYFVTPEKDGKQFLKLAIDNGKVLETVSLNLLTNKWNLNTEGENKGLWTPPTFIDYFKLKLAVNNCGVTLIEDIDDDKLLSGKVEIIDIIAEPEIIGYQISIGIETTYSKNDKKYYKNYMIESLKKPDNFKEVVIKTIPEEFKKFNDILTNGACYFPFYFPLCIGNKDPMEGAGSWKKNKLDFKQAYSMMQRGHNIGIAATDIDDLCIVDVDDMSQVPDIKPTLQISSRKRIGRHNFFTALDETAKKNIATGEAGEVRSVWQYVVAAGSYVECSQDELDRIPEEDRVNAGRYTVCKELPVSDITYGELPIVYRRRDAERTLNEMNSKMRVCTDNAYSLDKGCRSKLWSLNMSELTGIEEDSTRRVAMPVNVHPTDSNTGKNASVSNGLLQCWRHDCCHNAFSYLSILAGVTSCECAGRAKGGDSFGIDFNDGEIVLRSCYAHSRR